MPLQVRKRRNHASRRPRQRGVILIETLVGIAVISTTVLTGLMALSTASIASDQVSETSTASWIIVSQTEMIRTLPYVATGGSYQSVPADDIPAGFTVQNTTSAYPGTGGNPKIQVVTITVSKGGEVVLAKQITKVDR